MRIVEIEAIPVKLSLRTTLHNALAKYEHIHDVYVRVRSDEGVLGYGATAPKYYITGETQATAVAVIDQTLKPVLLGEDPFNMERIHWLMDRAIRGQSAAKAGIDLALYDLQGKALNVPVYRLLGGAFRMEMPAFDLISLVSPQEAAETAQRRVAEGYRELKLKAGPDPKADLARLEAVRAVVPDIPLKVDVNQSWQPKQAIRIIRAMQQYNVEVVEQPVPAHDLAGLQEVRAAVEPVIMADESLQGLPEAFRLAAMRAADAWNVKMVKAGGLYKAKKIAALAEAAGISIMAGCTLENNLVDAGAAHLLASTKNVLWNEVKAPTWVADDPASGLEIKDGMVHVPTGPGLGMAVDEELLERKRVQI